MGRAHPPLVATSAVGSTEEPKPELEEVYRAHSAFVWRSLRRFGIEEEALEDLVHAVFLVVRKQLPTYERRGALTSWLYGIARGVAANHRRARHRRTRRELAAPMPAPSGADPEERLLQHQALKLVSEFLATLSADQRTVFELCELEGLSGPEVAEALSLPLTSVYSRLRLARRRFNTFVDQRT